MYSEKSIVFVDLWFIFTFLQTTGEYYRCFKHKSNKKEIVIQERFSFIKRYKTDVAHFFQQHSVSELNDQITKNEDYEVAIS